VTFSARGFYYSLAALLLLMAGLNAVVAYTTRNSVPRRQMARARQAPDTTVLAIGNSLIGAGFDESSFDRGMQLSPNRGSLNFALGYSLPVEQLLFLRFALQHQMHPRIVIYGFYDLQLSTPVRLATRDFAGNRAVLYYLEPEYARQFYYLSLHDRIEFEIMRHFPMTVDRGAFWAKIERLRRDIGQQGMPAERTNQFGRADDFALLEAKSDAEFASACDQASNQDLISPVLEIIRQGQDSGAKIVFVEMPMRPAHVKRFYETAGWEKYREHVRGIIEPKGVEYVDASHWISDGALFDDPLHMGHQAAEQFSERLGEYLRHESPSGTQSPNPNSSQR
jgi:hypothetical protein